MQSCLEWFNIGTSLFSVAGDVSRNVLGTCPMLSPLNLQYDSIQMLLSSNKLWLSVESQIPNSIVAQYKYQTPLWRHCLWRYISLPSCSLDFRMMKQRQIGHFALLYSIRSIFSITQACQWSEPISLLEVDPIAFRYCDTEATVTAKIIKITAVLVCTEFTMSLPLGMILMLVRYSQSQYQYYVCLGLISSLLCGSY